MSSINLKIMALALCCVPFAATAGLPVILHKLSTDRNFSQVLHVIEEALPTTGIAYEYTAQETEQLKKQFAKPQPHSALTKSKNTATKKLVEVLSARVATAMLVTFSQASTKQQLHLDFKFGYENVGRSLVPRTIITVTTTKILEPWQKEWLSSIIKVDSMLMTYLLGAAGGVIGWTIADAVQKPAKLRAQRKAPDWMKTTKELMTAIGNQFGFYEQEIVWENLTFKPGKPTLPALQSFYDSSYPEFDTDSLNIPENAMIVIVAVPGPGAITALAQADKLIKTTTSNQVRCLVYPSSHSFEISLEIKKHKQLLDDNNWLSTSIPSSFAQHGQEEQAQTMIKILLPCLNLHNNPYTKPTLTDLNILTASTTANQQHIDCIQKFLSVENYLVRYPDSTKDSKWRHFGNEDSATLELVVFPLSYLDTMVSRQLTKQETSWGLNTINLMNIPHKSQNIKKSIVCVVNDIMTPYVLGGAITTQIIRTLIGQFAGFYSATILGDTCKWEPSPRFDCFFSAIEPTSSLQQSCIHYVASSSGDTYDDSDDSRRVKVFSSQTSSSTIDLTYKAMCQYAKMLVGDSDATKPEIIIDEEADDARHKAAREEEARLRSSIPWSTEATEADEFERFQNDTWNAIKALLKLTSLKDMSTWLKTSADTKLSAILTATPEISHAEITQEKYRLAFAQSSHCDIYQSKSYDAYLLAHGFHLVVWGNPKLTAKNSKLFVNICKDGDNYIVKANMCTPSGAEFRTIPEPGTDKTLSYQDAVVEVAKAVIHNQQQYLQLFSLQDWEEIVRTSVATLARTGDAEPVPPVTPQPRREAPTQKPAQVAMQFRPDAFYVSNIVESLQKDSPKVVYFSLQNNRLITNLPGRIKHADDTLRVYIIFLEKELTDRSLVTNFYTHEEFEFSDKCATDAAKRAGETAIQSLKEGCLFVTSANQIIDHTGARHEPLANIIQEKLDRRVELAK